MWHSSPLPKYAHGVLGPLIGLRQEHAAGKILVDVVAQLLKKRVRLRQVLAIGPRPLEQIGHGVQPHPVDSQTQPVIAHVEHGLADQRVVEIQIGLMRIKTVPVIGLGQRVPSPVRHFEILEDDPRVLVLFRRVAPDVKISLRTAGRGPSSPLKPGMLIRGVIDHQFGDHAQTAGMRLADEHPKIAQRAVHRIDMHVIGDVIAVVPQGRRIKRQQPQRSDAQLLQIVEFLRQAGKIAHAVVVAVEERANMELIDYRVFVPGGVSARGRDASLRSHSRAAFACPAGSRFTRHALSRSTSRRSQHDRRVPRKIPIFWLQWSRARSAVAGILTRP